MGFLLVISRASRTIYFAFLFRRIRSRHRLALIRLPPPVVGVCSALLPDTRWNTWAVQASVRMARSRDSVVIPAKMGRSFVCDSRRRSAAEIRVERGARNSIPGRTSSCLFALHCPREYSYIRTPTLAFGLWIPFETALLVSNLYPSAYIIHIFLFRMASLYAYSRRC